MKKSVLKIIALLSGFLLTVIYTIGCAELAVNAVEGESQTYLVIGLDDAAENADVIMLVGYNSSADTLTFLQIPRDTYYNYGGGQNKINGLFAYYRASGDDERSALSKFSSGIASVFDVNITASFAITIPALLSFVDKLGGIKINMPYEFTFTDEYGEGGITVPKGENLLDSAMAERFVRYRRGYSLADLSRLDAQKIFFSGVVRTVSEASAARVCRAAYSARSSFYTDCKYSDFLKMLVKKPKRDKKLKCSFLTLPGEAIVSGGISYYCANFKSSREVLGRYFGTDDFDGEGELLKRDDMAFYNAYYDENSAYREYSDDTLDEIKLK